MKISKPAIAAVVLAAGLALSLSFWPGIMIWDSGRQYDQALSGKFDDWHPPLMEGLWRLFIPVMPGPAPMLMLQLALYGFGLGALVWRARGQKWQAIAFAATALFPPTILLLATIIKDALMAACLLAAFALFCRYRDTDRNWPRVLGFVLVLAASALRYNAFLAGVPLLFLVLPQSWTAHRGKAAVAAISAALMLLAAMPLANRALRAERSGTELSLVIFDLAGIGAHGGGNVFPPLAVANIEAVNQACYDAEKWDPYSWWVDHPCLIQFADIRASFAAHHINPELFWITAILRHPIAYAEHRLAHFAIDSHFWVKKVPERWIVTAADPANYGFVPTPNIASRIIAAATLALDVTPLGWPWVWMVAAFVVILMARRRPNAAPVLALAASGLLYGLGYAGLGVASELRYYCWTMMAALIAAAMLVRARRPG